MSRKFTDKEGKIVVSANNPRGAVLSIFRIRHRGEKIEYGVQYEEIIKDERKEYVYTVEKKMLEREVVIKTTEGEKECVYTYDVKRKSCQFKNRKIY